MHRGVRLFLGSALSALVGACGAEAGSYGLEPGGGEAASSLSSSLGFDGRTVRPDCDTMDSWYNCRDIGKAPAQVRLGYEYVHHTSSTLGPDGRIKFPDGTPYANSSNACSSCHFTGGQVAYGLPFYQVGDKYASRPYFRAFGYRRDARDSISDCFRNCMGNTQVPPKDGDVMNAIVAYIEWVEAGVIDPGMKGANWEKLPGHSWPYFAADWMKMAADLSKGRAIYSAQCHSCHSRDGAGQGEYRRGETRPRYPALWGERSFTKGAAMYSVPQLAFLIKEHMPFGDPDTLTEQEALDVAGFINAEPRATAHSARMYCDNDPETGLPNSLFKPAHWNVGCVDPAEPFTDMERLLGPWEPIDAWRKAEIARRSTRP